MKRFLHFVQYHNVATLIVVVLFGAASTTFAASDTARKGVFSAEQEVVAIDNTFLIAQDLETFPFDVQIISVQQDDTFYYVDYSYTVIELVDYTWKDIEKNGSMKISHRQVLGQDLGLFVAGQLGQIIEHARRELEEVQMREQKRGGSPKVVATKYSGLVGRFLDTKTKAFPGYDPVVKYVPPQKEIQKTASVSGGVSHTQSSDSKKKIATEVNTITNGAYTSGPGAPTITLLGKNPARIPLGASYSDWGARVTDDKDEEELVTGWLTIDTSDLDTSALGTREIRFSVTDSDGNTATVVRLVEVYDPYIKTYTAGNTAPEEEPASTESVGDPAEEETDPITDDSVANPAEEIADETTGTTTPESQEQVEETSTTQEDTATSSESVAKEEPITTEATATTTESSIDDTVATSTDSGTQEDTTASTEEETETISASSTEPTTEDTTASSTESA
ncbi:MAG: DUF5011 domain-containing protein [bacterium]|nr:DUF5011 domain-containing protein [bacterium]